MNAVSNVFEVSIENFQSEVIEKSKTVPVLLEFYADEAEPSQQLAPVLNRLAEEYKGKFLLARVDIQKNQQLVQQLQVRTLPTIKIISAGQVAENLEGPQEESKLRMVLDQLTMSSMERLRGQLDVFLSEGDRDKAITLLQQVIGEEPNNYELQTELCDLLIMAGKVDEAKLVLAAIPADHPGISKPKNRLEFLQAAAELASVAELTTQIEANPDDLQMKLDLATQLVASDEIEPALDQLLDIMKKDKEWQEQLARRTMIKVFDLLGKGNELATAYRRKMFTYLH